MVDKSKADLSWMDEVDWDAPLYEPEELELPVAEEEIVEEEPVEVDDLSDVNSMLMEAYGISFADEPQQPEEPAPVYRGEMADPAHRARLAARERQRKGVPTPSFERKEEVVSPPLVTPLAEETLDPQYTGLHGEVASDVLGARKTLRLRRREVATEPSPTEPSRDLIHESELRGPYDLDRGVIHNEVQWESKEVPGTHITGSYSDAHKGYIHPEDYEEYIKYQKSFYKVSSSLQDMADVYGGELEAIVRDAYDTKVLSDPDTGLGVPVPDLVFTGLPSWVIEQARLGATEFQHKKKLLGLPSGEVEPTKLQAAEAERELQRVSIVNQLRVLTLQGTDVTASEELAEMYANLIYKDVADRPLVDFEKWEVTKAAGAYFGWTEEDAEQWMDEFLGSRETKKLILKQGKGGPSSLYGAMPLTEGEASVEDRAALLARVELYPLLRDGRISQDQFSLILRKIDRTAVLAKEGLQKTLVDVSMPQGGLWEDPLGQFAAVASIITTFFPNVAWSFGAAVADDIMNSGTKVSGEPSDDDWADNRTKVGLEDTILPLLGVTTERGFFVDKSGKADLVFTEGRVREFIESNGEDRKVFGPFAPGGIFDELAKVALRANGGFTETTLYPSDVLSLTTPDALNAGAKNLFEHLKDKGYSDSEVQRIMFENRFLNVTWPMRNRHMEGIDDDFIPLKPGDGFIEDTARKIWARQEAMTTEDIRLPMAWPAEYPPRETFAHEEEFARWLSKKRSEEFFASGKMGKELQKNPKVAAELLAAYYESRKPRFKSTTVNFSYHLGQGLTVGLAAEVLASFSVWDSTRNLVPDKVWKWLTEDNPHLSEFETAKEYADYKSEHMAGWVAVDHVIFGGLFFGGLLKGGAQFLSKKNVAILEHKVSSFLSTYAEMNKKGVSDKKGKELAKEVNELAKEITEVASEIDPSSPGGKALKTEVEEGFKKEQLAKKSRREAPDGSGYVKETMVKDKPLEMAVGSKKDPLEIAEQSDIDMATSRASEVFGENSSQWPPQITELFAEANNKIRLLEDADWYREMEHPGANFKGVVSDSFMDRLGELSRKKAERALDVEALSPSEMEGVGFKHLTKRERNSLFSALEIERDSAVIALEDALHTAIRDKNIEQGFYDSSSGMSIGGRSLSKDEFAQELLSFNGLRGEDAGNVLRWVAERADNPSYAVIADKIASALHPDTTFRVDIPGTPPGQRGPYAMRRLPDPGYIGAVFEPHKRTIWVNGAGRMGTPTVEYLMHEFVHGATSNRLYLAVEEMERTDQLRGAFSWRREKPDPKLSRLVSAAEDLESLLFDVKDHMAQAVGLHGRSTSKAGQPHRSSLAMQIERAEAELEALRLLQKVGDREADIAYHEAYGNLRRLRDRHKREFGEFSEEYLEVIDNTHELLAYGMTNPRFQSVLESIARPQGLYRTKGPNLFTRFVDIIRDLLGLEKGEATALTRLIRITEDIVGQPEGLTRWDISPFPWSISIKPSKATEVAARSGRVEYPIRIAGEGRFPQTPQETLAITRTVEQRTVAVTAALGGVLSKKKTQLPVLDAITSTRKLFEDALGELLPDVNPLKDTLLQEGNKIFNEMESVPRDGSSSSRDRARDLNKRVVDFQNHITGISKDRVNKTWDAVTKLHEKRRRATKKRDQAKKLEGSIARFEGTNKAARLSVKKEQLLMEADALSPAVESLGTVTTDIPINKRIRSSSSPEVQLRGLAAEISSVEGKLANAINSKDKVAAAELAEEAANLKEVSALVQEMGSKSLARSFRIKRADKYTMADVYADKQGVVVVKEVSAALLDHHNKIKAASGRELAHLESQGRAALFRNEQILSRLDGFEGRQARSNYIKNTSIADRAEALVSAGVTDPFVYAQLLRTTLNQWKSRERAGRYAQRAGEVEANKGISAAMVAIKELAAAKGIPVERYLDEQGRMSIAHQLATERGVDNPAIYAFLGIPDRMVNKFVGIGQKGGKEAKPLVVPRHPDAAKELFSRDVKAISDPYSDLKYTATTSVMEFFSRRMLGDWTIDAASGKTTAAMIPSAQKIYAVGEFLRRPTAWIDMPGHFRDAFSFMLTRNGGDAGKSLLSGLAWLFVNNSGKLGPDFHYATRRLTSQKTMGDDISKTLTLPFYKDHTWKNIKDIQRILESVELANKESIAGYAGELATGYQFFANQLHTSFASSLAHRGIKDFKFEWVDKEGVSKTYTMDFAELRFKLPLGDKRRKQWYTREELQEAVTSGKISEAVAYGRVQNIQFKNTRPWSKLDGVQKSLLLFFNEHLRPIEERLWDLQAQMHLAKDRLRMVIVDPVLNQVVRLADNKVLHTFPNTKMGQKQALAVAEKSEGTTVRADPGGQVVKGFHLRNDTKGDGIITSSNYISEFYDGRFAMDMLWDFFQKAVDDGLTEAEFNAGIHKIDLQYGKVIHRTRGLLAAQRDFKRQASSAYKKKRKKEGDVFAAEAERLDTATGIMEYYKDSPDSPLKAKGVGVPSYIERFHRMKLWGDLTLQEKIRSGLFDFREGATRTMAGLSHNVALSGFLIWLRENGVLKTGGELSSEGFTASREGMFYSSKAKGFSYEKIGDLTSTWGDIPPGLHIESRAAKALREFDVIGKSLDGIIWNTWNKSLGTWKLFQVANVFGGTMMRAIIGNATQLGVMAPIAWSPKYANEYFKDVMHFRKTGKASKILQDMKREGHGGATFAAEIATPEAYLKWQMEALNPEHSFWSEVGKFGDASEKRVRSLTTFFSQDFAKKSSDNLMGAVALHQMKRPLGKTARGYKATKPGRLSWERGVKVPAEKVYKVHQEAFAGIDDVFKGSMVYQYVRDHGWTVRDALRVADKYFMDYRDIAPVLNAIRKSPWAIGEAFVTFSAKWQFLVSEFVAQNPGKSWAWASFNRALNDANLALIGWTREDLEAYKMATGEHDIRPGPTATAERRTGRSSEITDIHKGGGPGTGPLKLKAGTLGESVFLGAPPMWSGKKFIDALRRRRQSGVPLGTDLREDLKTFLFRPVWPAGGAAGWLENWMDERAKPDPDNPFGKLMESLSFEDGLGHVVNEVSKGLFANYRHLLNIASAYEGKPVMGQDASELRAISNFWGFTTGVMDWADAHRLYEKRFENEVSYFTKHKSALIKDAFSARAAAAADNPTGFIQNNLYKSFVLDMAIYKFRMSHLPKMAELKAKEQANLKNVRASYNNFIKEGKLWSFHKQLVDEGHIDKKWDLSEGIGAGKGIELEIIEDSNGQKEVYSRYGEDTELTDREKSMQERRPGRLHEIFVEDLIRLGIMEEDELIDIE